MMRRGGVGGKRERVDDFVRNNFYTQPTLPPLPLPSGSIPHEQSSTLISSISLFLSQSDEKKSRIYMSISF